mmetsp:Transcript_77461/g.250636  ORF Transcript_77461/g.250636 Transcript_77461/m.250636 type:complete len:186 (-) Transcript_77461:75-632(-)
MQRSMLDMLAEVQQVGAQPAMRTEACAHRLPAPPDGQHPSALGGAGAGQRADGAPGAASAGGGPWKPLSQALRRGREEAREQERRRLCSMLLASAHRELRPPLLSARHSGEQPALRAARLPPARRPGCGQDPAQATPRRPQQQWQLQQRCGPLDDDPFPGRGEVAGVEEFMDSLPRSARRGRLEN